MISKIIATPADMENMGAELAQRCIAPAIIFLKGELGAGKTTLVRGFLRALGHHGHVKSPTYTIVEPYELATPVYHFDLYRLSDYRELELMGFSDYFDEKAICIIEWPEIAEDYLPKPTIYCTIDLLSSGKRALCVRF